MNQYTRHQLSKAAGETKFVIGHLVRSGLLPPADGAGYHRHYTDAHLHRLLAIKKLRARGLRGGALADRLRASSHDDILRLAGVYVPPPPAPPPPVRSQADLRRALQSVIHAAADALDIAPKRARAGLEAAFAQMKLESLTVEDATTTLSSSAQKPGP